MAFGSGRSNSLSLNTGATNSLFAQQNQNQQQNPPSEAGSLFGNTQPSQPQQQSGGLFGNTSQQPAQSGGMFGSTTNASQPAQSGGLFGSTLGQQPAQQQQSGGGLFGSSTQQPQQQNSGSLFGSSTQQPQQQQSGGLFGASAQQQQPASSGLFSSLNQSTQPQQSSLFGNSANNSLFGPKQGAQNNMAGSSFYNTQNQQTAAGGNSIFGLNAVPASQLDASLLRASQFRASQAPAPFVGKLSMGQGNAAQPGTVGAVKVHANDLRSTTRFQDCVDEVKQQFEKADEMIQKQEAFCSQIQAFLAQHEADVKSISPDVTFVKDKADAVEQTLATDAQAVEARRKTHETDRKDFERCRRVVENMKLPTDYRMPSGSLVYGYTTPQTYQAQPAGSESAEVYDTDLIGNYFLPMASELQDLLNTYSANLAEIEGHMKVIEQSAIGQAQQLAAKRVGAGGAGQSGEETVRELADTLRGFEQSILGVAGVVGACREGVTDLSLGRLSETIRARDRGRGW